MRWRRCLSARCQESLVKGASGGQFGDHMRWRRGIRARCQESLVKGASGGQFGDHMRWRRGLRERCQEIDEQFTCILEFIAYKRWGNRLSAVNRHQSRSIKREHHALAMGGGLILMKNFTLVHFAKGFCSRTHVIYVALHRYSLAN